MFNKQIYNNIPFYFENILCPCVLEHAGQYHAAHFKLNHFMIANFRHLSFSFELFTIESGEHTIHSSHVGSVPIPVH
jgi:hypothetical protein